MRGWQKRTWWLAGAGLLVAGGLWAVVGGGLLGSRGSAATPPAPEAPADKQAVAVTVEPVTPRPVQRAVTVVGSLYGRDEVTISAKVEGPVLRIHRDVMDVVKAGDVLMEIDPTDFQLAVNESRRALELELSKLGLKELPSKPIDIGKLPSVVRAESLERNALLRLERMRRLAGNRAASAEDRDQAETDYAVAQANHQQVLLDARAAVATVHKQQAALDTALQRLKDTRVLVPGKKGEEYVVCGRGVAVGDTVRNLPGASPTLFKLVVENPLKLLVNVPERYRRTVKVGQTVELEVEEFEGERFSGKVSRIYPSVDRANRTFMVEALVANQEKALTAGSFARASILTRVDAAAPTVPEEALVTFAGVTKVFLAQDGKVRAVPVRPGATLSVSGPGGPRTWVEVQGNLPAGARVITTGQTQLADGTAVRVKGQ